MKVEFLHVQTPQGYHEGYYARRGTEMIEFTRDQAIELGDILNNLRYDPDPISDDEMWELVNRIVKPKENMSNDLYNSDWINIDGNSIHKSAIVHPNVKLGTGNTIGAYCVIGSNGEIRGKSQNDFRGTVHIGNNNVISEHVTIQRPYEKDKSTIIGDRNILMAHSHIGHDAYIGNDCEICTSSIIGGYVTVYDKAKIKIGCNIRNRLIIGSEAIIGMGSVVVKNVPNFAVVYGNPAKEKEEKFDIEELVERQSSPVPFLILIGVIIGLLAGVLIHSLMVG